MSDKETAETPAPRVDQYTTQNARPVIPEGMSKNEWKRQQKKLRFEESKAAFQQIRKEKKMARREQLRAERQEYKDRGEEVPEHLFKRSKTAPKDQVNNGGDIIMDCSFDDLMNNKEIVSMSTQITRAYSAFKLAPVTSNLKVTSFGGNLKKRFDETISKSGCANWKHVSFHEEHFKIDDPSKFIYLSADSDDTLTELDPSYTYIVGGIVDKNRHKNLCNNKAKELGIKTAKLPIAEYIQLSGRTVLTTGHVLEIMLKWYEFEDWKKAFEAVLPDRKVGLTTRSKRAEENKRALSEPKQDIDEKANEDDKVDEEEEHQKEEN